MDRRIAPATAPTNAAAMNGARLGMSSVRTISMSPWPLNLETSTYARFFNVSTCARTTRAVPIQEMPPIRIPSCSTVNWSKYALMVIKRIRPGMVIRASLRTTTTASIQPPKYPAKNPSKVPMPIPIMPAMRPIQSVPRVPYATYANMSMANWSDPNQYCLEGLSRGAALSLISPLAVSFSAIV